MGVLEGRVAACGRGAGGLGYVGGAVIGRGEEREVGSFSDRLRRLVRPGKDPSMRAMLWTPRPSVSISLRDMHVLGRKQVGL